MGETQNKTQQSWLYFKDVVACSRSFSLFPIKIPIPALYTSVFALKITLRFTTRWSKWWWRCKSLWRPSRTLKRRSPRPFTADHQCPIVDDTLVAEKHLKLPTVLAFLG